MQAGRPSFPVGKRRRGHLPMPGVHAFSIASAAVVVRRLSSPVYAQGANGAGADLQQRKDGAEVPGQTQAPAPASRQSAGRPGSNGPSVFSVFGLATDDANGTVWVSNTRQHTVAVYRQSDLGPVKQFPGEAVPHSREVAVDAVHGRAYVSAIGENIVAVFDTKTLSQLPNIEIPTNVEGGNFIPTSLDVDAKTGKVYTVSLHSLEARVIDCVSGKLENLITLEGVKSAIGVAYDRDAGRLLVASSSGDDLLIVDVASGKVLHDAYVGAGALNMAYEPVSKLVSAASTLLTKRFGKPWLSGNPDSRVLLSGMIPTIGILWNTGSIRTAALIPALHADAEWSRLQDICEVCWMIQPGDWPAFATHWYWYLLHCPEARWVVEIFLCVNSYIIFNC